MLPHLLFSTLSSLPFLEALQSYLRSRVLNNLSCVPAPPDCLQFLEHDGLFPMSGLCIFCSLCQECPSHLLYPIYTYLSFKRYFRWHLFRTPPFISSLCGGRHNHFYIVTALCTGLCCTVIIHLTVCFLLHIFSLLKSKKPSQFHFSSAGPRPEGD